MSGRPKWLIAFKPVNILVLLNLWKWFSQMYCNNGWSILYSRPLACNLIALIVCNYTLNTSKSWPWAWKCFWRLPLVIALVSLPVYFIWRAMGQIISWTYPKIVNSIFKPVARILSTGNFTDNLRGASTMFKRHTKNQKRLNLTEGSWGPSTFYFNFYFMVSR